MPSVESPPVFAPHMSDVLFDWYADERAVFGPRAVVVLHIRLLENLMQHEPRVCRPLPDAAVGNRVLGQVDASLLIQLLQLVVAPEGAVVVRGLRPRDVLGSRNVAGALR